ncbi:transglycosylase family protein [Streptomyces sp. NPDC048191]|uniref:transglycosylase family protein n=1 Tax=Streptomyces sp. NPDC048191 TaxID=3155484 RepID=UPI0034101410
MITAASPANAATDNVWSRLATCESSSNWAAHTGNGFTGGLQFTKSTWRQFGGTAFAPTANEASRGQQVVIAKRVQAAQGWNAWPSCSRKIGLAG